MKQLFSAFSTVVLFIVFTGCGNNLEEKGFALNPQTTGNAEIEEVNGIANDSLSLQTRPGSILLTGMPQYRLTSVFKVNRDKRRKTTFIGHNQFHSNYTNAATRKGNQWNYNFMPGWSAIYGYNMVNVSHYDTKAQSQKNFFEDPVLIKTLYYPAFSQDTLNYEPVKRNFFMISAYDEDTNRDGFINTNDLRRFYHFDIHAEDQKPLVPRDYSVLKSQYDPANDRMYVFAQRDENNNGQRDEPEDIHIFWIDLNNPNNTGRQY